MLRFMNRYRVRQRDLTDCGAACLASVASWYRLQVPVSRVRQLASTDRQGTNVLGMIRAAEQLGFTAKGVRGQMEALQAVPLPVIAHVMLESGQHHYVVIYRVSRRHVTVMDPDGGVVRRMTHGRFAARWSGVLVLLSPSQDFRRGRQRATVARRFWQLVHPHRGIMVQALLGSAVYTLLGLSTAIYVQLIIDHVLTGGHANLLRLLSVVMLTLLACQLVIGVTKSLYILRTGQQIDYRLMLGYYHHLLQLPQRFFDTMRVGELISRVNDAMKIRTFINDVAIGLSVSLFILLFSFVLMFTYFWKLAVVMLAIVPAYLVIYLITNAINRKNQRTLMERSADLEAQLVESLGAMATIKRFALERYAGDRTETRFSVLLGAVYRAGLVNIFADKGSEFLTRLFTIVVLWSGAFFVLHQQLTAGELMSFYAVVGYFTGPVGKLIGVNAVIQDALIAADRLFEIMDLEREQETGKSGASERNPGGVATGGAAGDERATALELLAGEPVAGDIRFEKVSFRYGSRIQVLRELDLTVQEGRVTAVVGESGSGKTSLANVLQRLYPIDDGRVLFGQWDLHLLDRRSVRTAVGVVPQQIDLFSGTVLENIAIGEPEPDVRRALQVCGALKLMPFIDGLPDGLHTQIGENGAGLSGGEKQRVAIARLLYRSPGVMVLDEPTSALDADSEAIVQQVIGELRRQGKTVLLLAHRLSTVCIADRICVLEKGRLVEQGTHEQLLARQGRYFQLYRQPFSGMGAATAPGNRTGRFGNGAGDGGHGV